MLITFFKSYNNPILFYLGAVAKLFCGEEAFLKRLCYKR